MTNFIALLLMAWYVFTGFLFAELMRVAAKQHSKTVWTISYAAIVFGWLAIIPPTVFANAKKGS